MTRVIGTPIVWVIVSDRNVRSRSLAVVMVNSQIECVYFDNLSRAVTGGTAYSQHPGMI